MPEVALDLHVHSALSPCAADEMRPPTILLTAERRGLAAIALVDHGTARNAAAFEDAARAFRVRVVPGLEVETVEGVHLLALFDTAAAAADFETLIAAHTPPLTNRPDLFGEQWLMDELGNVTGQEERLLLTGTDLDLSTLAELIREHQGLAVPAHVDRETYGLFAVLGFLPADLPVEVLEVSFRMRVDAAVQRWPALNGRRLVSGSDAHCLADIGRAVTRAPAAVLERPVAEWNRWLPTAGLT